MRMKQNDAVEVGVEVVVGVGVRVRARVGVRVRVGVGVQAAVGVATRVAANRNEVPSAIRKTPKRLRKSVNVARIATIVGINSRRGSAVAPAIVHNRRRHVLSHDPLAVIAIAAAVVLAVVVAPTVVHPIAIVVSIAAVV